MTPKKSCKRLSKLLDDEISSPTTKMVKMSPRITRSQIKSTLDCLRLQTNTWTIEKNDWSEQPTLAQQILPIEIWAKIFEHISLEEQIRFRLVCRLFARIPGPTGKLIVAVACHLPLVRYLYSKQPQNCSFSEGFVDDMMYIGRYRRVESIESWNVKLLLNSLPILCPFLRSLKLAFLAGPPADHMIDVALFPRSIQSLEVSYGDIELINPSNVQLPRLRRLIFKNALMKNFLHAFPNLLAIKFDMEAALLIPDQQSKVRKLVIIDYDSIDDLKCSLFLNGIHHLILVTDYLIEVPNFNQFHSLKIVDYLLSVNVSNIYARRVALPWLNLAAIVNQMEQSFGDLKRVAVFLNGVRLYNTIENVDMVTKFIKYSLLESNSAQAYGTCPYWIFKAERLNRELIKIDYTTKPSVKYFIDEMRSLRHVHELNIKWFVGQQVLNEIPHYWPNLCEFSYSPSCFSVTTKKVEYDFSFLLQLRSLQYVLLEKICIQNLQVIVEMIEKLPYLRSVNLISIDCSNTMLKKLRDAMKRKKAKYPANRYTMYVKVY